MKTMTNYLKSSPETADVTERSNSMRIRGKLRK